MRYTTSIIAASLASTALAAGHRHEHKHRARAADAAADPEATNYTYSNGQCWGAGNGCDATTSAGAAQTSAAAQPTQTVEAQATSAPAAKLLANPASAVKSVASKATSAAGSVASSVSSGAKVDVSSIVSQVQGDVMKAAAPDGSCVEGTSANHPNVMEVKNNMDKPMVWTCWGSKGSWVNQFGPVMTLGIAPGDTATLSFADTPAGAQGGGCAPVFEHTKLVMGQIHDTWLEATFNQWGTVDVSREPNVSGTSISASCASGCQTNMDTCVFVCNDEVNGANNSGQCGEPGSYHLKNCSGTGVNAPTSSSGPVTDGGCQVGNGKMSVVVG